MFENRFFQKHRSRIVAEGVIKAVLCGLTVGAAVNFLMALLVWFFDFGGIWLALGVGAGAGAICGVLFYVFKFKPLTKEVAARVDRLGLEERMITMLELQNDDSYIAELQRKNAQEHLKAVEDRKIRIKLSHSLIVFAVVACLLGGGMTTVAALADQDVIPSGSELVNPEDPMEGFVAVTYIVEEGGLLIGEADQVILLGEDGTPVVVQEEEGWIFVGWETEDGESISNEPEHQAFAVTEDITLIAIFEEIGEGMEGSEGDGSGNPEDADGDSPQDAPNSNNGAGENGKPGENGDQSNGSQGSNGENDQQQKPGDPSGEDGGDGEEGGQGGSGKLEQQNQFLNGNTYYKDKLAEIYEKAQDIFAENGTIPPELIEFFENYYNSI